MLVKDHARGVSHTTLFYPHNLKNKTPAKTGVLLLLKDNL